MPRSNRRVTYHRGADCASCDIFCASLKRQGVAGTSGTYTFNVPDAKQPQEKIQKLKGNNYSLHFTPRRELLAFGDLCGLAEPTEGCRVDWSNMEVGFFSRSEAVGVVRTAMVSAENLQLTLKTGLNQEEQALTKNTCAPKDDQKPGYERHQRKCLVHSHQEHNAL